MRVPTAVPDRRTLRPTDDRIDRGAPLPVTNPDQDRHPEDDASAQEDRLAEVRDGVAAARLAEAAAADLLGPGR